MKKLAALRSPVVRLGIGIALSVALLLGSAYQRTQDHGRADAYAEQIGSVVGSLDTASIELSTLPGPASLTLQKKGAAREYASQADKAIERLKRDYPSLHRPLSTLIKDARINNFNQVVVNREFAAALQAATDYMKQVNDILSYHAASLRALANLLEYDPVLDTSADDLQVGGRLTAAGEGLTKINETINKLSGVEDNGKESLLTDINSVNEARQTYLTAITEASPTEVLKQNYISVVVKAQKNIQTNRQEFWSRKQAQIVGTLESRASSLRPFSHQLYE